MTVSTQSVTILGGGIGGLAAAISLASAGHRVVLFEQNERIGGKMGEHRAAGFRWDSGPSVITMRNVFEALFEAAGQRLEEYLSLKPIDPLTRYFFWDGAQVDICRDLSQTLEQIAALEERDVEGYLAFLAEAARVYRIVSRVFLFGPPPTFASLRMVSPGDVLSVDLVGTLQKRIERAVSHPHVRQLLGRFATYVGASPYLAPAVLASIAHVELAQGIWYPQGGVYELGRAYERLATQLGVEIHYQAQIKRLRIQDDRLAGLELENGESLTAGIAISNIDVTTTYALMDAPIAQKQFHTLSRQATSCSGFVLLLGIEGSHPALAHHNVFFSKDYRREFEQIFRQGRLPDDPTIYVAITSKSDSDHAPAGCENWFVLANAPPLTQVPGEQQEEEALAYAEHLLQRLAERGFDLRSKIRYQKVITPRDLQRLTGAWRGALYGISFNNRFTPFLRHGNRSPVRGLYFAGGSVHPGGGLPLATLSGIQAARLVLQETGKV